MNEKPNQNGFCEFWPQPRYKYTGDLKWRQKEKQTNKKNNGAELAKQGLK